MEFFIPSLFIVLLAAIFGVIFIPRLTPLILVCVATIALVVAISNHSHLFSNEYKQATWPVPEMAPYLIVGSLVLILIGYVLLLFFSGKGPSLPPKMNVIPPPKTATNPFTEGIGNSLVNSGFANVEPLQPAPPMVQTNNRMNTFNTALSKGV
jgi:hypothetical protein